MRGRKVTIELEWEIAERLLEWLYEHHTELDGHEAFEVMRDHGKDSLEWQNFTRDLAMVGNVIEILELAGVGDDETDD